MQRSGYSRDNYQRRTSFFEEGSEISIFSTPHQNIELEEVNDIRDVLNID